jgi:hypothetical protein
MPLKLVFIKVASTIKTQGEEGFLLNLGRLIVWKSCRLSANHSSDRPVTWGWMLLSS